MSQPCASDSPASAAALAYGLPYGHFHGSSSGPVSSAHPYTYSGRSMSQSCASGSPALAMGSYGFPYGAFAAAASSSQASQSYFHGGAFSASYGASEPSPSPPSQPSLSSCQQSPCLDYSMYPYTPSAGYYGQNPYAYLPSSSSSSSTAAAANGFSSSATPASSSITNNPSSASSSPTYQSIQSSDATNFHYQHSLDNVSPPGDLSNGSSSLVGGRKGPATKSSRGRGRRAPNPSPSPENALDQVFIWDLDETLIILYTLLTGSFAQRNNKNELLMQDLGKRMEDMLYNLGDRHFFYNDLEDCDQVHVDDVASDDTGQDLAGYDFENDGFRETRQPGLGIPSAVRGGVDWMRKLAFRYRRIKEIYNQYHSNVDALIGSEQEEWRRVRSGIEDTTDGWLTLAHKCLRLISQREKCANILVTPTPLIYAISKVLLHRLGPFFPIENIYSSAKVGYENVYEKLMQKYGKNCTFVVIGDGMDEESAAKKLQMPFWKINGRQDLANLYLALEYNMM